MDACIPQRGVDYVAGNLLIWHGCVAKVRRRTQLACLQSLLAPQHQSKLAASSRLRPLRYGRAGCRCCLKKAGTHVRGAAPDAQRALSATEQAAELRHVQLARGCDRGFAEHQAHA